jgi:hypothetical protein
MLKTALKVALASFLWAGSLVLTAQFFFQQGAYYGYDVAAKECNLYALQELFKKEP